MVWLWSRTLTVHTILSNPAIKQTFLLPSLSDNTFSYVPRMSRLNHLSCGIAYAAASMVYKVALAYEIGLGLAILSVGVNVSWRQIPTDHFSEIYLKIFSSTPVIVEGFICWEDPCNESRIMSLDVETEILTLRECPFPRNGYKYYFSTGRSLSAIVVTYVFEARTLRYLWQLWEMDPETKEWNKLGDDIMSRGQDDVERLQQFAMSSNVTLQPIGWFKYPEVLALRFGACASNHTLLFCNLHTDEFNTIQLPKTIGSRA